MKPQNPYKEVVKSIADMAERYAELQSLEELKDFYNNVRVKCLYLLIRRNHGE